MSSYAGTSRDDLIIALGGAPNVVAGAGHDTVLVGGSFKVDGGTGDDTVYAISGGGLISGGGGDDIIVGNETPDVITGGAGNDVMTGGQKADFGGGGRPDTFQFKAGFGSDIITDFSFEDGDRLNFFAGSIEGVGSSLTVETAHHLRGLVDGGLLSVVDLGHGNVRIDAGGGNGITLMGLSSEFGFDRGSTLSRAGSSGADTLLGSWGDDVLFGGRGDDILLGGTGNDRLAGDEGNDKLLGGLGNDVLTGGAGDDQLFGELGSDILAGGAGNDLLAGGAGDDRFQFGQDFGRDIIADLNFGEGDVINLFAGAVDDRTYVIDSLSDMDALVVLVSPQVTSHDWGVTIGFGADRSIGLVNYFYDSEAGRFFQMA